MRSLGSVHDCARGSLHRPAGRGDAGDRWDLAARRLPALQGSELTQSCVRSRPGGSEMPFVLPDPEGLAPEVYPLAWLLGVWRGEGVVDYPGIDEATFTHEVVFDHDGGPYLSYSSTIRLVEVPADPAALVDPYADVPDGAVWQTESGYWRVPPERPADHGLTADQHPVELLVADPSGH